MDDRVLKFIGLSRKAGKLSCGEVNTCSAVKTGKAVLTMVACDASLNAIKRLEDLQRFRNFRVITLPYSKEKLAQSLGTSLFSICAVTDANFASQILKLISDIDSEDNSL